MALDDHTPGRSDLRRGIVLGAALGLLAGFPAGAALKAAGYPSDELYAWWVFVGAAYMVVLAVAAATATRRRCLALGLVTGTTSTIALTPLVVVLDILVHTE